MVQFNIARNEKAWQLTEEQFVWLNEDGVDGRRYILVDVNIMSI
jgi:hypothetical protein